MTHAQQAEALVKEHWDIITQHDFKRAKEAAETPNYWDTLLTPLWKKSVNHAILTTEKQLDLLEEMQEKTEATHTDLFGFKHNDLTAILTELKKML